MQDVITTEKIPIKFWLPLDEVEEGALEQAKNLANLPFAKKWIAIMPDTHQGYGMPIGGVLATKGVVVPNAVGVDIGCGMGAVKTNLTKEQVQPKLKSIMGKIRETVPVGFNHHDEKQSEDLMPPNPPKGGIVEEQYERALYQIGTMGGGNHFLEIQHDEDGTVYIMIHSGSRNIGFKVAEHYHKLATQMCEMWHSNIPTTDLSFLPLDTNEGQAYMDEMNYCVEFAEASRALMLKRAKEAFLTEFADAEFNDPINIAHNYASMENHYGDNLLIHRKGATLARKGTKGIIPGSQGSNSYIVTGKGNAESFCTCSHGAGRTMSRTQAKKTLDLEAVKKKMDDKGIVHAVRHKDDLDEAPEAYKDINVVMDRQKDLVDINVKLTPMGVVKG